MPSLDPAVQPTSTLPAPPGHELQHASSIGARSPRTGDSFHYPECRPQSPLLAGASTPRTSLQHDYPPPVPGDGHKKRASMAPIPSVALLSSVPGGVCVSRPRRSLPSGHPPSPADQLSTPPPRSPIQPRPAHLGGPRAVGQGPAQAVALPPLPATGRRREPRRAQADGPRAGAAAGRPGRARGAFALPDSRPLSPIALTRRPSYPLCSSCAPGRRKRSSSARLPRTAYTRTRTSSASALALRPAQHPL